MKRIPSVRERNIVLIGFMGVGKTSVGEQLAKRLFRDFIDVDQEIEKTWKMKISDIFRLKGEEAFRKIEREMTIDYCTNTSLKVISLGGGAYMQDAIRTACLDHCIVIYLDLSWSLWKERLNVLIDNRPVLQDKKVEEMEQLFTKRQPTYQKNSFQVETDGREVAEIVSYLEEVIKLGWEIYGS
ncbi:shikimate kinase [Halalkalibacterium halodurans]|jgi:shikimate kinase|uniref:Shikimate kinase n=1 Tax=Halalkalibacterium halodurans TaxID=86665 RepID=A0A0M0KDT7_ALKHA|nr:shikimate kinase [Halalkalibacterium halodurans]MDY7220998.1 shikimate kinase [Halalkalibacterium halodurans]MDY7240237.1 shikimate kinase [Halalkalibacterium halodurans]MED3645900.1 shikimate kinase [Halalkalibacterium halodurans]MED4162882.1 shikimate kinase [Halalkalibacterium halodurans]TES54423.1 shikimate kinase [Halalkalibacterium halodurans]